MRKTKYKLTYSKKFDRDYRGFVKGNRNLEVRIIKTLLQLGRDPFYQGLKTHRVHIPNLGRVYSSRVTGDLRVVWRVKEGRIIFLYRIGGHSGSSNIYR